ncbi:MAG: hypothetical protein DRG34_07035, partial [Deltaproteobacteria bacterium]
VNNRTLSDQRPEIRGRRSEVRGQRSEIRGQRSEVRDQQAEGSIISDFGFRKREMHGGHCPPIGATGGE